MFCPSCGTQVDNNVAFCPVCGTGLRAGGAAAPAAQPVMRQAPTGDIGQVQTAQQPVIIQQVQQPEKNPVGMVGFVLSLIGVICLIIPSLQLPAAALCGLGGFVSFIGLFMKPRGAACAGCLLSIIDLLVVAVMLGAFASIISGAIGG